MASCFVKVNVDSSQQAASSCSASTVDSDDVPRQQPSDVVVEQFGGYAEADSDGNNFTRLGISERARVALQQHLGPRALQPGWYHIRVKDGKLHVERAARVTQLALTTLAREVQNKTVLIKEVLNSRCRAASFDARSGSCCFMVAACANHDAKKGKRFGLLGLHGSYYTADECKKISSNPTAAGFPPSHLCRWSSGWGSDALVLCGGVGTQPRPPSVLRCIDQLGNVPAPVAIPDCSPNVELEYVLHVSNGKEFMPHIVLKACRNIRLPDTELMADLGDDLGHEQSEGSKPKEHMDACPSDATISVAESVVPSAEEQPCASSPHNKDSMNSAEDGKQAAVKCGSKSHHKVPFNLTIPDSAASQSPVVVAARENMGCNQHGTLAQGHDRPLGKDSSGMAQLHPAQMQSSTTQGPCMDGRELQSDNHNLHHASANSVGQHAPNLSSSSACPTTQPDEASTDTHQPDSCDTPRPVACGKVTLETASRDSLLVPSKRPASSDSSAAVQQMPKRMCLEAPQLQNERAEVTAKAPDVVACECMHDADSARCNASAGLQQADSEANPPAANDVQGSEVAAPAAATVEATLKALQQAATQHIPATTELHHSKVVSSLGMNISDVHQQSSTTLACESAVHGADSQPQAGISPHQSKTNTSSALTCSCGNLQNKTPAGGPSPTPRHMHSKPETNTSPQQPPGSGKTLDGSTPKHCPSSSKPSDSSTAMPPPPNRAPPSPRAAPDIPFGALFLGRINATGLRHATRKHDVDQHAFGEGSPLPSQVPVQLLRLANASVPSAAQHVPTLSHSTSLLPVSPALKKATSSTWTLNAGSGLTSTSSRSPTDSAAGTEEGSNGSAAKLDAEKQQRIAAALRSKQQQAQQHMAYLLQIPPSSFSSSSRTSASSLSPLNSSSSSQPQDASTPQTDPSPSQPSTDAASNPTAGSSSSSGQPSSNQNQSTLSTTDQLRAHSHSSSYPEQPAAKRRRRSSVLHLPGVNNSLHASISLRADSDGNATSSEATNGYQVHAEVAATASTAPCDTSAAQTQASGGSVPSPSASDGGNHASQGVQQGSLHHARMCLPLPDGATLLEPDQCLSAKVKANARHAAGVVGPDGARPEGGVWAGAPPVSSALTDQARAEMAIYRDWRLFKAKYDKMKRELLEYKQKCDALQHRNIHLETAALALREVQTEYHKLRTHYLYWKEMSDKVSEKNKQLEGEVSRVESKRRQDVMERDFWQQRWDQANLEVEGLRDSLQEARREAAALQSQMAELKTANEALRKSQQVPASDLVTPPSEPQFPSHPLAKPVHASNLPIAHVKDESLEEQPQEEDVANSGEAKEQESVAPDTTQELKMSRIQVADLEEEVQFLRRQLEEKNKRLATLLS